MLITTTYLIINLINLPVYPLYIHSLKVVILELPTLYDIVKLHFIVGMWICTCPQCTNQI